MIQFKTGNLLEAEVEALVNTVNTVGVMGKGIALMFKERFPANFRAYDKACKTEAVRIGKMFVTANEELYGPRWIVNFPTKKHWRTRTKLDWVREGLTDLKAVIEEKQIQSIAIPPLGCGNGGLDWADVRPLIESALADLDEVDIIVYEPTRKYQNVAKRKGVEKLTPARALMSEMVRRYWVLGIECTLLEAQKLAWFLSRMIEKAGLPDPLKLSFEANRYGPYDHRLQHLLNSLDGSYLHSEKRIADARAFEAIWFNPAKREYVALYLKSEEASPYQNTLEATDDLIDGFQSPLGMEALATVDWLIVREGVAPTLPAIQAGIRNWPAGTSHAQRKARLFDDRLLALSLERLETMDMLP